MKHLVFIQYKRISKANEIFYAISSFRKYAKFEYDLFVLGDKILEFPEIERIAGDSGVYLKCRAQHIRVARDIKQACTLLQDRYDEFCLISDDFFYLNDFTWDDLCIPKYNKTFLDERRGVYIQPNYWRAAKQKTARLINSMVPNAFSYTTHAPAVCNIQNILSIIEQFSLTEPPNDYTIEDLYGNFYYHNPVDINKYRCRVVDKSKCSELIDAKKNGLLFANVIEADWWEDFETVLKSVL